MTPAVLDDERRQFAAVDTARVESLCVSLDVERGAGVVTVYHGRRMWLRPFVVLRRLRLFLLILLLLELGHKEGLVLVEELGNPVQSAFLCFREEKGTGRRLGEEEKRDIL
jgi:hypothetical protein